jgi:hypothetical protein
VVQFERKRLRKQCNKFSFEWLVESNVASIIALTANSSSDFERLQLKTQGLNGKTEVQWHVKETFKPR